MKVPICRRVVEVIKRKRMFYEQFLSQLRDPKNQINFTIEMNSIKKASDDYYEDYHGGNLIVVWEPAVQPLTDVQRIIFFALTIFVAMIAIPGNFLVLYVNFSRFLDANFIFFKLDKKTLNINFE